VTVFASRFVRRDFEWPRPLPRRTRPASVPRNFRAVVGIVCHGGPIHHGAESWGVSCSACDLTRADRHWKQHRDTVRELRLTRVDQTVKWWRWTWSEFMRLCRGLITWGCHASDVIAAPLVTDSKQTRATTLHQPKKCRKSDRGSRARLEKDLTEPTNEENQAYKPTDPISGAHYGHRTEDAIALSHVFSPVLPMRLSRADDLDQTKKPAEPLKIFRLPFIRFNSLKLH